MRVEGEYKTKRGGPIRDEGNNIVDYDPVEKDEMQLLSCPVCHEVTLYKEVFNEEYGFTDILEYCYPNISVKREAAAILPFALAFAGGTMLYVISDEMIPETHAHGCERAATYALLIGFCVMLISDVLLG